MSHLSTFTPSGDTYIHCLSAEGFIENYGGSTILHCGSKFGMLLRFQVSGIPAGATVEAVTLDLVKTGSASSGQNYLREMFNHTWTEYGATWAYAVLYQHWWWGGPFTALYCSNGFGTGLEYGNSNISTLTSTAGVADGTVFTFISTAAFIALLQRYAGSNGTLDLCCPFGAGFSASSRSGSYPPQLKVTFRLAAPTISSFSPLSATVSGTTITVQGSNFGLEAGDLDNIKLLNQGGGGDYNLTNQTWISGTQVRGDLPASAAYGTYRLQVTIDGQSCTSSETFAYYPSGPYIASITPGLGKAMNPPTVSLQGYNFNSPVTEVVLVGQANQGEHAAASFTRVSSSQITAVPPLELPLGRYRVRVIAGGATTLSDGEYCCRLGPVVW
jgi:hypothetical protein